MGKATAIMMTNSKDWALFCSVVHHGLGALSGKGIPPSAVKVIETAKSYEAYLDGEEPTQIGGTNDGHDATAATA